ncbi:MAG: transporter substrate-binding domain-containing protein [Candidatus Babeliales bacterium]
MNRSLFILIIFTIITFIFIWQNKKNLVKESSSQLPDVLVVGTNAEYPPFSFMEQDRLVGLDIDLMYEIAKRLGKKLVFKNVPFDILLPKIQTGEYHILAAGLSPSEQREATLSFTTPYWEKDPLIIVQLPSTPPLTSSASLSEKRIVVNEGFTSDFYVSSVPNVTIKRLNTMTEALLLLQNNQVDAFVTALSPFKALLTDEQQAQFSYHVIPDIFDSYALAISKKHPFLFAAIDKIIRDLIQDGTREQLLKKWQLL